MLDYRSPVNRTRSTEWMLACLLLVWGYRLVSPEDFFDGPTYIVMASLGNEVTWGVAAMGCAMFRLMALYINGWWRRTPIIRCAGAIAGGSFWMLIGSLMYMGAHATGAKLPPGWAYYAVFFVFEGWCIVSTGYDMAKEGSFGKRPPERYVATRTA